ncbi:tethering complex subunit [Martiniozyma asiatica (nom. inval.)]|nr:tethering complex subunit [Martiniozyma asiatica]
MALLDPQLFSAENVQLQFSVKDIFSLNVTNNVLLLLANSSLFTIDLDAPETVHQFALKRPVVTFWSSPQSWHCIGKTQKYEYFYIPTKGGKVKALSKLKGLDVCKLLWFSESLESSGPMLVLTTNGQLYEYWLENNSEGYFKKVWDLKEDVIEAYRQNIKSNGDNSNMWAIVLVCKSGKLIQFKMKFGNKGYGKFLSLFKEQTVTTDLHHAPIKCSANKSTMCFSVLIEGSERILLGPINFKSENDFSAIRLKASESVQSIMITNFHVLIYTTDNVLLAYNQLDHQICHKENFSQLPNVKLTSDYNSASSTYWMYTEHAIYELVSENESDGIWKLLTALNRYDEALSLLNDEPMKREFVMIEKGKYLLGQGNLYESAKILAKTSQPLEVVIERLSQKGPKSVLRYYLENKLETVTDKFKGQKIILTSWIVELFVEELDGIDRDLIYQGKIINNEGTPDTTLLDKKRKLLKDMNKFLAHYEHSMDKKTVYQIIENHNRHEDLLEFAILLKDYYYVMKYYVVHERWEDSLKVLLEYTTADNIHLLYDFSTSLLINLPSKTVDVWIRLIDLINPLNTLPALLVYNKNIAIPQGVTVEYNQALRWLKYLIFKRNVNLDNEFKILANTFWSILVTYPSSSEDHILKFLELASQKKRSQQQKITFDHDFILRLCFKHNKIQTSIFIYSFLEKYELAIDLALKNDLIEVAITVADRASDESRRKQLWLKVAKKLVSRVILNSNSDVDLKNSTELTKLPKLIEFLSVKCPSITIGDLLPLLPPFYKIDIVQDPLINHLNQLSTNLTELSEAMTCSVETTKQITEKLKNFKNDAFQVVEPYESCALCHNLLSLRKFVVFPCFHSIHQDCLVKAVLDQKAGTSEEYHWQQEIISIQTQLKSVNGDGKKLKEIRRQMDIVVTQRCVLCSNSRIGVIGEPLLDNNEAKKWSI